MGLDGLPPILFSPGNRGGDLGEGDVRKLEKSLIIWVFLGNLFTYVVGGKGGGGML
jgi:hypothetical protein